MLELIIKCIPILVVIIAFAYFMKWDEKVSLDPGERNGF